MLPERWGDKLSRVPPGIYRGVDIYLAVLDRLITLLLRIGTAFVLVAVGLTLLQIGLRNTVGSAPSEINTLATWLVAWASFLLLGVLVWHDDHLKIEVVFQRFPERLQRSLVTFQLLIYAVFGLVLAYLGWNYALTTGPIRDSIGLGVEMTWLYSSLVAGGFLLFVFSAGKILYLHRHDHEDTTSLLGGGRE